MTSLLHNMMTEALECAGNKEINKERGKQMENGISSFPFWASQPNCASPPRCTGSGLEGLPASWIGLVLFAYFAYYLF